MRLKARSGGARAALKYEENLFMLISNVEKIDQLAQYFFLKSLFF